MAGIAAPQTGGTVEHSAAVGGEIVHVLGAREQPRRLLERAVRRERQPIGFEIVGDGRRHVASRRSRASSYVSLSLAAQTRDCYHRATSMGTMHGRQIGKIQQAQG